MPSWNIVKWFLPQYWCKWPWFPRCSVFPVRCQAFPVIPSCCLQEQTWFQSGEEQGGSDVMISALIWVCIFTCCVKVLEGFTEPHNIHLCIPVISLRFHQFRYMALQCPAMQHLQTLVHKRVKFPFSGKIKEEQADSFCLMCLQCLSKMF